VTEQATYAPFEFPKSGPFNGFSYMKFDADINAVTIRSGASVNTKNLGTWTAGLTNDLKINAVDDMRNLTANIVYRIYTVVQPPFIIKDENSPKGFKGKLAPLSRLGCLPHLSDNVTFFY
jgi:glutamate receptor, ionotropic, invertebrate